MKNRETVMSETIEIMTKLQSGEITLEEANETVMRTLSPKRKNIAQGIEEVSNETWVNNKSGELKLMATFTLRPLYIVRYRGDERFTYELTTSSGHKTNISFRMGTFLSYKDINAALELKNISAVAMPDYGSHISKMLKYWTDLGRFNGHIKEGTEHIGLVQCGGKYYYASPDKVYDVETGNKTDDIEYLGKDITSNSISKMGNQKYNPATWGKVLRAFATNVYKINRKETILPVLGWITMLAHEYVMRHKVSSGNGYPLLFLIGLPGSGKSATAKTLAPYLGWANTEFGKLSADSQFGVSASMLSSYNIPVIFDEYGKPNPKMNQHQIDEIISAAYDKTTLNKGQADLKTTTYPMKNAVMVTGEQPPQTRSLQERGVIVEFDKSYIELNSESEAALNKLEKQKDKNFFAGMVIAQRQMYSNDDIVDLVHQYEDKLKSIMKVSEPRIRNKILTIMVGLHCYIEMCKRNGLLEEEIGVGMSDILDVPKYMAMATANQGTTGSVLDRLFETLDDFRDTTSPGNKASDLIGKGKHLFIHTAETDTFRMKVNGKIEQHVGYMKGKRCLAININPIVGALDTYTSGKLGYNSQDARNTLRTEFNRTASDPNNEGLVLCPQGYRIKGRDYAMLDLDKVRENVAGLVEMLEEMQQKEEKPEVLSVRIKR